MTFRTGTACLAFGLCSSIACGAYPPSPAPPQRAPSPPAPVAPEPPEPPETPSPRSSQALVLKELAQLSLQPTRGRRAARATGQVAAAAFLPPDGRHLVAGGGDSLVWIADSQTGATHWRSPQLGSDVQRVAVCDQRFVAQTAGGRLAVYEWVPEGSGRVIDRGRFDLGAGALHGVFGGCAQVAYATLDDKLLAFDVLLGRTARILRDASYALFESRANEHGWIFVNRPEGLRLYNLADAQAEPTELSEQGPGRLMQAHAVGSNRFLTEHCTTERACTVRLLEANGTPRVEHRFDGSGSPWRIETPSRIAFSTEARYIAWYREGLPLQVVETATGRRAELEVTSGYFSSTFSPYAPGTFAVASGQGVRVYEVR